MAERDGEATGSLRHTDSELAMVLQKTLLSLGWALPPQTWQFDMLAVEEFARPHM